jgi:hypothetical protein
VDAAEKDPRRKKLCFDALHSLWLLGEPDEYFLGIVREHRSRGTIATYAASVLLREPTDGRTIQEVQELVAQLKVSGSLADAIGVGLWLNLFFTNFYHSTVQVNAKAELLVDELLRIWDPYGVDEYDPHGFLRPVVIWCRKEIAALSEAAPVQTALYIFDRQHLQPGEREFLAQFLHPSARRVLARLMDAEQ